MEPTRKTFVEFFYPGALFDESSAKEVSERDPAKVTVPKGAFAFQFHDAFYATADNNGETVELWSKPVNQSPKYYVGGTLMTVEDVKRDVPNSDILVSNMEGNGWGRVIRTICGNFQPFEEGKAVLLEMQA